MSRNKIIIISVAVVVAVILIVLSIVLPLLFVKRKGNVNNSFWLSTDVYNNEKDAIELVQKDDEFTILNLTDVQLNDVYDIGSDELTFDTIDWLIKEKHPDLITITGDLTWAPMQMNSAKKLVKKLDSYKIPWAPVMGNHDGEGNCDREWLGDLYENAEYSLFKKGYGNLGGVGNYVINVVKETPNGKELQQTLFFMDSHAGRHYEKGRDYLPKYDPITGEVKPFNGGGAYDYIYNTQQEWYRWVLDGVRKHYNVSNVDSMVFIHIPLPEFTDAYNLYRSYDGKNASYNTDIGFGRNLEEVCAPPVNSGFFDVIKDEQSTKHVVAGHDHVNYSSIEYQGVRLTYGLKTGDRCYWQEGVNGGTLFVLKDKKVGIPQHLVYNNGKLDGLK